MLKTVKVVAAVAAMLCASASSFAGGVTVDLFDTPQAQMIDGISGNGTMWNQIGPVASGVLGGYRELGVEKISGGQDDFPGNTFGFDSAKIGVNSGVLKFSSDAAVSGRGTVRWDGGGLASTRDYLLGADLSAYTAGSFELLTVFADLGFKFSLTAYTDAGNYSTITLTSLAHNSPLPGDPSYIPLAAFAACGFDDGSVTVTCGGLGVDWAHVGALEAVINSDGLQLAVVLTLNQVDATVPEPGSLALVGLALLGIGAARRRKA